LSAAPVLLGAGAALAQLLPEPSLVPDGLDEPCRLELQGTREAVESARQRLAPLVETFEAECVSVATDDAAMMAYCAEREATLGAEVDAYFASFDQYEQRVVGAPEQQRLGKAIRGTRVELAKTEELIAKLRAEIERAGAESAKLAAAIEEWATMARDERAQAIEDGLMLATGHVLDRMSASKKQASDHVIKQYNDLVDLYRTHVSAIQPQHELLGEIKHITKDLAPLVSDLDVLGKVKKLHGAVGLADTALDLQTREKMYRGIIDVLSLFGGPAVQKLADGLKFGESLSYWALTSYLGAGTADVIGQAQSLNLEAVSSLSKKYVEAIDRKKALSAELESLEDQRAAIAYGCAGMV